MWRKKMDDNILAKIEDMDLQEAKAAIYSYIVGQIVNRRDFESMAPVEVAFKKCMDKLIDKGIKLRETKRFLLVEDGSIDIDEYQEDLENHNIKIIKYNSLQLKQSWLKFVSENSFNLTKK